MKAIIKNCLICQKSIFTKKAKTCSKKCRYELVSKKLKIHPFTLSKKGKSFSSKTEFQNGHGYIGGGVKKGTHLSSKTEFQKGAIPKVPFKKGHIPWNKGLGNGNLSQRDREKNIILCAKWRKTIFKRDNYTCQICKIRGGKLNADHIKSWTLFPKLRYKISNGRTLCIACHRKVTAKFLKDYWKNQFVKSSLWEVGTKTINK